MLNKEKYNLQQIDISTKTKDGKILFFELKIRGKTIHQQIYPCEVFACDAMEGMIGWLEEEYKPEILTDKEKAYLSAVIKPFRERTIFVGKVCCVNDEKEFIYVEFGNECFTFPLFAKGTMYKEMEVNREYTLKELGL